MGKQNIQPSISIQDTLIDLLNYEDEDEEKAE